MATATVYGVIATRMWLGTPGDSLLVAHSVGITHPIQEEELDALVTQERQGFLMALAYEINQQTGLEYPLDRIDTYSEWMWGVIGPTRPGLMRKTDLFVKGELKGEERKPVQEMGLSDIKEIADRWTRGAGRSLGS